ncbi:hypothetical protein B5F77_12695 [Parabacteroides sp. An277]|uniref:DUF6261 family protein n=1 Tax=Parabacteroides sp. An277 TaxID=1965619 RepID=UPI000B37D064|nr:DUF6261 family protein [Parabacteroides sp. An277]OUO50455.1 hypothetical protein B5F77_12695 [Parabacteroides sp. An277]
MDIPKQIEPFGITQLSVGACAQFHEMVNTYISQATPEALGIEAWAPDYRKATDQLAAIVPRQREWVVTQHWKKARRARANAIGVINQAVRIFLKSGVPARRQAAVRLNQVLLDCYGIGKHKDNQLTAEVRVMLSRLDEAENAAALATLGLTEEREVLREANQRISELVLVKVTEMGELRQKQGIKTWDALRAANQLYRDIVRVVNARAIVQPTETVNEFIGQIRGTVYTFKLSINHTGGRKEVVGGEKI